MDLIFNQVVVPKIYEVINKSEFATFDGEGEIDIIPVLKKHKELLELLCLCLQKNDHPEHYFKQLPEAIRPYVVWQLASQFKFEQLQQCLSSFPQLQAVLRATDIGTGNNFMHAGFSESGSPNGLHLKEFVSRLKIESLFKKENTEGLLPLDFFDARALDYLKTDSQRQLFLGWLIELNPKQVVEKTLEKCLLNSRGTSDLVNIVTYALQKELELPCCSTISSIKFAYENHRELQKVYPLLSNYLPVTSENVTQLETALLQADLPSRVLLQILSALPETFALPILKQRVHSDKQKSFFKDFINTGLIPVGARWDQSFPWNDLLLCTTRFFHPPEAPSEIKDNYLKALKQTTCDTASKLPDLPEKVIQQFHAPDSTVGIYGRSLYADRESADTLRVKLRKRMCSDSVEPLEELTREAGVLAFLREQQELSRKTAGQCGLDLHSRLPEPIGNFCISDPDAWLEMPVSTKACLSDSVAIDGGKKLAAYVFKTKNDELYHRYVHEHEGAEGLSRENSLKGLRMAAHDIGVLFRNGFSMDNALPIYHNRTADDMRKYTTLNQFHGYRSQGGLMDWDGKSTEYPNMSPWPVGLRDFAEIRLHSEVPVHDRWQTDENVTSLMLLANNMLALELLLARTLQKEFTCDTEEAFKGKVEEIKKELLTLYTTLYGEAFGMPEGSEQRQKLHEILQKHGVADQSAREMVYWCETGDNPCWVKDMKEKRISEWAYPLPDQKTLGYFSTRKESCLLKSKGFMCSTHNPDLNLGIERGWFILAQSNCMKTMAIAAGIILGGDRE